MEPFSRTELLIGKDGLKKLAKSKVIIFGIGGVGSYAAEALARAGVGHMVLVDSDKVDITNLNRQIEATFSSIGKYKVDVMKERILDINPNTVVETYQPDKMAEEEFDLIDSSCSYVIDAIDTMKNKIKLIEKAYLERVNIIASAGAGNKLEPTMFEVSTIDKTSVCPVCKILRKELKKRGITNLKVVYSKEIPKSSIESEKTIGSISFVPSVAGLIIASEVVKDLIK